MRIIVKFNCPLDDHYFTIRVYKFTVSDYCERLIMAQKLFSLVLMLVLGLPVVILAFAGDESKAPAPAEVMQKQIADAIKVYGEKKEVYRKDVLDLFERKEKFARDKGDLKTLNLIKKEKDAFFENGKDPSLFLLPIRKGFWN